MNIFNTGQGVKYVNDVIDKEHNVIEPERFDDAVIENVSEARERHFNWPYKQYGPLKAEHIMKCCQFQLTLEII